MIQFRLFGIPVQVEWTFWLSGFLLGGGLSVSDKRALVYTGLWMIVVFVSILVHELGHALSGRRMAGGQPWIKLWALGGLAYNERGRFTRKTDILMTLAGPGAGFLLFLVTVGVIFLLYPGMTGLHILDYFVRGSFHHPVNAEAKVLLDQFVARDNPTLTILYILVWINLWWGLVNLLPIYPLDGGHVAAQLMASRRKTHQLGMIVAIACGIGALLAFPGQIFYMIFFGVLAWMNYTNMKNLRL